MPAAKKAPAKKAPAKKMPPAKKAPPAKKGPPPKAVIPKTVDDLKGARYNPRVITDKQLAQLRHSLTGDPSQKSAFGDLSGVVFNRTTGVLVSGHQRLKAIKPFKNRLVKEPIKRDGFGTVAIGRIEVQTPNGVVHVPYREVEWSDAQVERAGNIAANAMGGEFDQQKLGAILQELQTGAFDIETTGLNSFDAQKSLIAHRNSTRKDGGNSAPAKKGAPRQQEESSEEFQEIDPEAVSKALTCKCPKCGFRFEAKKL